MEVSLIPDYDRQNGWLEILPSLAEPTTLGGDQRADHVVVGAGFGGLAAARRLAELNPESLIILLEGGRVGNNAAGRCSGFIIDHAHNIRAKGFAEDPDRAKRGIALNREGSDWLAEIVSREGIDCQWSAEGKIHAAASSTGEAALKSFAHSLDAVEEPYEMLDATALKQRFGTDYYRAGLLAPGTVLVNPAALVRGLAETMPANVRVFEDSMVTSVEFGSPHRLVTANGNIITPSAVLATNGYSEGFGIMKNRLIPLITWGSMTRQLTGAELDRLGGEPSYGIIPAHVAGTTVRRLPEGRIVIRNRYTFSRWSNIKHRREHMTSTHRRSFETRFPMLADVPFEFTWGGALSLSRNSATVCGQVASGLYATMAYQGTGMAKGTISGKYLAESMMGEQPPLLETLTTGKTPSRNVPQPFNGWGVAMNIHWRRRQAGIEE